MKFALAAVLVFVLAFAGGIVGLLALTGNLNADALARILGTAPQQADPREQLDKFARELTQREQELKAESQRVEEEKQRIGMAEEDLQSLVQQLNEAMHYMDAAEKAAPEETELAYEERLAETANTLAAMDEANAARALEQWTPERAAEVLLKIREKDRGGILDEMTDDEQVAQILEHLKDGGA